MPKLSRAARFRRLEVLTEILLDEVGALSRENTGADMLEERLSRNRDTRPHLCEATFRGSHCTRKSKHVGCHLNRGLGLHWLGDDTAGYDIADKRCTARRRLPDPPPNFTYLEGVGRCTLDLSHIGPHEAPGGTWISELSADEPQCLARNGGGSGARCELAENHEGDHWTPSRKAT